MVSINGTITGQALYYCSDGHGALIINGLPWVLVAVCEWLAMWEVDRITVPNRIYPTPAVLTVVWHRAALLEDTPTLLGCHLLCVSIVILTANYTHIKNNDCIIITSVDCFVIKLCPRIFTFLLEITNFIKMWKNLDLKASNIGFYYLNSCFTKNKLSYMKYIYVCRMLLS